MGSSERCSFCEKRVKKGAKLGRSRIKKRSLNSRDYGSDIGYVVIAVSRDLGVVPLKMLAFNILLLPLIVVLPIFWFANIMACVYYEEFYSI